MVEESIPTFEAFCEYHDVATMAADQEHIAQYESIVGTYASYAALKTPVQPKGGINTAIAIRWRSAGLQALKSITASEAVGADGGKQINIIMPVILQNLQLGDEGHLRELQVRAQATETEEIEQATRRRMSIATVRTAEGPSRPTSTAMTGTADDADRLAEEEVGVQAIQCLKQIIVANNRAQIRLATGAILKFIVTRAPNRRPETSRSTRSNTSGTWATTLMEMVTRWAPVQDRFVIVVTLVATLVRSPVIEENLEQHLLLVSLIGWLLRSNINMIGLSVMDVLLGLIQHILLLLQLGGKGSTVLPHHQQTDAIDLFKGTGAFIDGALSPSAEKANENADESQPSTNRQRLLDKLQRCIGDLATHIYYSDQISDIITAILLRLKPSPMSGVATAAAAIEHPQAAVNAISASANLKENPETDEFFSFGTARVTALKAIKEVLTVANMKSTASGGTAIGRNRVSVQVWEGTQWLLRDDDRRVRRAYVDSLLTWLRLEMSSNDLRVLEDKRKLLRTASKTDVNSNRKDATAKRAASNASQRDHNSKPTKSTFLQLLHLAIYDTAIETPGSEPDLLLIHLLLISLVEKLGVNAAKTGLPMIMRLQEDINVDELIPTPVAKVNIGSLVHGYLWNLCSKFDFDTSTVGFVIQNEISRRKQHGLWLDTIQVPPLPLERIMLASSRPLTEKVPLPVLQAESVKPFDSRPAMVDLIAEAYARAVTSPPNSPPSSPGRVFSMPILSSGAPASGPSPSKNELPLKIREAMLSEWSKEDCIASVEKESIRTVSLNGSRKGTNLSKYLGVNGHSTRDVSPSPANAANQQPQPVENKEGVHVQPLNFAFPNEHRHSSVQDTGSHTPMSSSDQNQTLRVDDLKRVLAGGTLNSRGASPLRNSTSRHDFTPSSHARSISSSSDSVVSAEGFESASEGDLSRPMPPPAPNPLTIETSKPVIANHPTSATHSRTTSVTNPRSRPLSVVTDPDKPSTPRSLRRPSTSSSGEDPIANAAALRGEIVHPRLSHEGSVEEDEVPPVPPLPAGVMASQRPISTGQIPSQQQQQPAAGKKVERASVGKKKGVDVTALLGSIDAVAGEKWTGGMVKPPY